MMARDQFERFPPFEDQQNIQAQYLQSSRASLSEQDTVPLAALNRSTHPVLHKEEPDTMPLAAVRGILAMPRKRDNLSTAVHHMISTGLTRLQDPQPEGLFTRGLQALKPLVGLGAFPALTLTNAIGLLLVCLSYYVSVLGYGNNALECFFYAGLLLLFVPNLVRLLSPAPSRLERICLVCGLGLSFYLVQFMTSPLSFSEFDEFLHWRTGADILMTGHLFSENSMLPVSPYYPGLEIVTNAVSTLTGLSTFYAGALVISASRLLIILALFLFYEQITSSSRMAGMAVLIYMTNVHFLLFDAIFNYETLALPLATFMFYILSRFENAHKDNRWVIFTAWLVLAAVTITHHMTDYVFDGLLVLWSAVSLFRPASRTTRVRLAAIALCGVLFSLAYAFLLPGNPVLDYLSEYYGNAFNEIGRIFAGISTTRPLFNTAGQVTPLWDKLLMAGSVGIIAVCLPFGLFSLERQHRHNVLAVMLGMFSFVYPIVQVFRFTDFGSEITDRSAAFLFLPIAFVLTILITHFWPTRTRNLNRRATSLIVGAMAVMLLGGVLLEAGPNWQNLPGPYLVEADQRSIEPDGIQAATWALDYLGPGHRVATDRTDQMLMHTYGHQDVVTHLAYNVDISPVFFSAQFDPAGKAILQQAEARYLVVDLRSSTDLPYQGFYFEINEPDAFHLTRPISRAALTKFNAVPQFNRLFDNGNIVIYDTGAIVNGSD